MSFGVMAADMNEDNQGPERGGGEGILVLVGGSQARNLHSPSKPSMAGNGVRAQEARKKGGKGRREDKTRLQDRIKQRQSPQIPPYELRYTSA